MSSNAEKEINEISSLVGNTQALNKTNQSITEKKQSSFNFKKYLYMFGGFCLICLILYLIFHKKEIRIFTNPIPYVYPAKVLSAFNSFLNAREKSDILVYYGKSGYGKSRFLSIAEQKLLKNYYFVIHCDFSVLTDLSTEKDVITILKDGLVSAVINSQYPSRIRHSHSFIESLAAPISKSKNQNVTGIRDQTLQDVASNLCSFIDAILKNAPYTSAFMNALDALGPAAFIINEPQKAKELSPVLFTSIYNELLKASIGSHNVGCICEVSDLDFIKKHSDAEHINFIEVGPFTLDESRAYLKGTFKPRQLTELYTKFGGCGLYYAKIFEQIRDGKVSFAQSISNVNMN